MELLIDTHIIIWFLIGDERLSRRQRESLLDPENVLILSPVVSYELTQLQVTGRIALRETVDLIQTMIGLKAVDLPAEIWRSTVALPDIHRDPVDRMLIAHTLERGATLVTADETVRRYDVPVI